MSQSLLSPTIITREALRILHAKLNFLKNVNRQYDKQFANEGASPSGKIGPSLSIRMPNRFTVRTGQTIAVQDVTEATQTLTVSTQKGVDINFTSQDLTLTVDEFGKRYLDPAMSVLASNIEADALSMIKDIYNYIVMSGSSVDFVDLAAVSRRLTDFLCPEDSRCGILTTSQYMNLITAMKGLFNPQKTIAGQYQSGVLGNVLDFDLYKSTLIASFVSGSALNATTYTVNGDVNSGASVVVAVGGTTFKKGDVVTFSSCNACHYETKADLGYLQPFVITADYVGGAGTITVSPSIVTSGASQNVVTGPRNNDTIAKLGPGASASHTNSLFFHPDAFAFVTADLIDVSKFGAWGAREVMDGISMRIARQYDIVNDKIPTRIDVLYGYKTLRPELACRLQGS